MDQQTTDIEVDSIKLYLREEGLTALSRIRTKILSTGTDQAGRLNPGSALCHVNSAAVLIYPSCACLQPPLQLLQRPYGQLQQTGAWQETM